MFAICGHGLFTRDLFCFVLFIFFLNEVKQENLEANDTTMS